MNRLLDSHLDAEALRDELVAPHGPWTRIDVVDQTGSTNADLLAAAAAGAADRTVLVARHQQAGRGRLTRGWVSPPGSSLAMSVLLRPRISVAAFSWLPLLAGLAVVDALHDTGSTDVGLKWPNDVLLGPRQRKVAGILAETAASTDDTPGVVVGIGINVSAIPEGLDAEATSVAAEGGTANRAHVLVALLRRLAVRESQWRAVGGDPDASRLRADYRSCCLTLGTHVRVELPGGEFLHGIAEDVDRDGRLLVLDRTGQRRAIAAGDVVHLRKNE